MALTALVDDTYLHFHIILRTVFQCDEQLFLRPLEGVAIDKRGPCDRRSHRVTVQVFHVTHRHIDGLFVHLVVAVEDVDHQLVVIERPIEIEFVQHTFRLNRRIIHCPLSIFQ